MKKEKKDIVKEPEQLIYVGPTIRNVVTKHTVFSNGINQILKDKISQMPEVGKLIVPVGRLQEVKEKIMIKGTVYNICYNKILEGGK